MRPKTMKKANEDTLMLCKYLFKYKACSMKSAIKELMDIDYIRNNYSKTTLYTYLSYVRHYAKYGHLVRKCPPMLKSCIETVAKKEKEPRQEFIEIVKEETKPVVKEEPVVVEPDIEKETAVKVKELNNKIKTLKNNYETMRSTLTAKRIRIVNKLEALGKTYERLLKQLTEERDLLEKTLMEELLLKEI